jgi:hypothetical protein
MGVWIMGCLERIQRNKTFRLFHVSSFALRVFGEEASFLVR